MMVGQRQDLRLTVNPMIKITNIVALLRLLAILAHRRNAGE